MSVKDTLSSYKGPSSGVSVKKHRLNARIDYIENITDLVFTLGIYSGRRSPW